MTYCNSEYSYLIDHGSLDTFIAKLNEFNNLNIDDEKKRNRYLGIFFELIHQAGNLWNEEKNKKLLYMWRHCKINAPSLLDFKSRIVGYRSPKQDLFWNLEHDSVRSKEEWRVFFRKNGIRLPNPEIDSGSIEARRTNHTIGEKKSKWDDDEKPHDIFDDFQWQWLSNSQKFDIFEVREILKGLDREKIEELENRYFRPFIYAKSRYSRFDDKEYLFKDVLGKNFRPFKYRYKDIKSGIIRERKQ